MFSRVRVRGQLSCANIFIISLILLMLIAKKTFLVKVWSMFSERFGTRLRRYLSCANLFILFLSYFPRTISTYLRRLSYCTFYYMFLGRFQPIWGGCPVVQTLQGRYALAVCRLLLLRHNRPHDNRWDRGNKYIIRKSSLIVQGMVIQHQRQCGGGSSPWFMLCLESHSVSCYSTLLVI